MSKEEFTSIYTQLEKVTGTGTAELVAATDPEQGTTVLKWTIQNNDVTIAPELSKRVHNQLEVTLIQQARMVMC